MKSVYYYTDFETFKLIIKNGTLRFKESTKSNDKLDTKIIYDELRELFNERYRGNESPNAQMQFLIGFFENQGFENKSIPVVACFTEKVDSRLLWDAYTMHRVDRKSERYNGVCISINVDKLAECMKKVCTTNDLFIITDIIYDGKRRRDYLIDKLNEFDKNVRELSEDLDQSQSIIPKTRFLYPSGNRGIEITLKKCIVYPMISLLKNLQLMSPLFKHDFWREEEETRALFCKPIDELNKLDDGAHYYDVPIGNEVINRIVLGPEFSNEDMKILMKQKNVIDLNKISFAQSAGTGVITSKG